MEMESYEDPYSKKLQKIDNELQDLENKLQDALGKQDFVMSHQISEQIGKTKATKNTILEKQHGFIKRETSKSMELQKKDRLNSLVSENLEKLQMYDEQASKQAADMEHQVKSNQAHLKKEMKYTMGKRTPKYSAELFSLQEMERAAVFAKNYALAEQLKGEIRKMKEQSDLEFQQECNRKINNVLNINKTIHDKRLDRNARKRDVYRDKLIRDLKREEERAQVRLTSIKDSAIRQVNSNSYKTEKTRQVLQTASEIREQIPVKKTSPKHEPVEEFIDAPTEELPVCVQTDKPKRKKKRKERLYACSMCRRKSKDPVAIPSGEGAPSNQCIGPFCSWKCAREWNKKYSPKQLVWERNMLIDEAMIEQLGIEP